MSGPAGGGAGPAGGGGSGPGGGVRSSQPGGGRSASCALSRAVCLLRSRRRSFLFQLLYTEHFVENIVYTSFLQPHCKNTASKMHFSFVQKLCYPYTK